MSTARKLLKCLKLIDKNTVHKKTGLIKNLFKL